LKFQGTKNTSLSPAPNPNCPTRGHNLHPGAHGFAIGKLQLGIQAKLLTFFWRNQEWKKAESNNCEVLDL
jgi:hypothetical protein